MVLVPGICEIGRHKRFPVKSVTGLKVNGFISRFFGRYATATLSNGTELLLNMAEYDLLKRELEINDGCNFVMSTINNLRQQMGK